MRADPSIKLMLVTQKSTSSLDHYLQLISTCSDNGVTSVQLRDKTLSAYDLSAFGQALKTILTPLNVPLIVNDHIDLCLALDAHGVHLGQKDDSVIMARQKLGPHKIIGLTINTMDQIEKTHSLPVNYIGIGSVFPTRNKSDAEHIWGLKELEAACQLSRHPVVAIGGIHENNADLVMKSGAFGIAAIGAFHETTSPAKTARKLRHIVDFSYHD